MISILILDRNLKEFVSRDIETKPNGPQMGMLAQQVRDVQHSGKVCTSCTNMKDLMLTFHKNGRHEALRSCLITYWTTAFILSHFTTRALMSDGKISAQSMYVVVYVIPHLKIPSAASG